MPKTKPLHFEPKQASEMDIFAAKEAARRADFMAWPAQHDPNWPGEALREVAQAPQIFSTRRAGWLDEPLDAKNVPTKAAKTQVAKPAARIPRDTEPCPLWMFVVIFIGFGGAALATLAYGVWSFRALLEMVGLL